MTTRWEVEKAVWDSDLDPPARLLMLALLRKADNDSAVVLPEFTPSLSTLEATTGLSRSAIGEWLNALDDAGWVKRTRPPTNSRTDRTTYALMVGSPSARRRSREQRKPRTDIAGSAPGGLPNDPQSGGFGSAPGALVREADGSSSAPGGPEVVRQADAGSAPGGPASLKESPTEIPTPKKLTRRRQTDEPERDDVDRVCRYLAEWMVRNGAKPPTISVEWRREARLMIDRDGRPLDEIRDVIRWCQMDTFWRKNILSIPKLRQQYDRLRLALEDSSRPSSGYRPYRNPTDPNAYYGDL